MITRYYFIEGLKPKQIASKVSCGYANVIAIINTFKRTHEMNTYFAQAGTRAKRLMPEGFKYLEELYKNPKT